MNRPGLPLRARMRLPRFRAKNLHKVATETALNVLAYNMKRVMAILGCRKLLEAMRA
jgi:hypothetical protein